MVASSCPLARSLAEMTLSTSGGQRRGPPPQVLSEQSLPDPIPLQDRIGRIAEPFRGQGEVVEVFQISFQRLPEDFGAASTELAGGSVYRFEEFGGYTYCNPGQWFPPWPVVLAPSRQGPVDTRGRGP